MSHRRAAAAAQPAGSPGAATAGASGSSADDAEKIGGLYLSELLAFERLGCQLSAMKQICQHLSSAGRNAHKQLADRVLFCTDLMRDRDMRILLNTFMRLPDGDESVVEAAREHEVSQHC